MSLGVFFYLFDYYGTRSGSIPDVISIPFFGNKFFDVLEENSLSKIELLSVMKVSKSVW